MQIYTYGSACKALILYDILQVKSNYCCIMIPFDLFILAHFYLNSQLLKFTIRSDFMYNLNFKIFHNTIFFFWQ